jgi:hypothetical protein
MKVAIIGCSFSDLIQMKKPNTESENWTYKLSQKYPQHEFRNYSLQSMGVEYFRIVFDECYDWADYILFQTTNISRRSFYVFDGSDDQILEWKEHTVTGNLSFMRSNGTIIAMNGNNVFVQGKKNAITDTEHTLWKTLAPTLLTNPLSDDISRKWINRVAKDPKVVILNFTQRTKNSVWEVFGEPNEWVKNGFVYSEDDHHFTDKGHTQVLNNFVLKTKINEIL